MNVFSKFFIAGALAFTSIASYAIAQEKVLNVTADSLSKEFRENQLKAEKKYKNAPFNIKGIVDSVGKDADDEVYIELNGQSSSIPIVNALLAPEAVDKAIDFDKGDTITLHCLYADKPHMVQAYSCNVVD